MRTIVKTRRLTAALALCSLLLGSGCFGNFALTRGLHHFNSGVHPNRWVQWGMFLGFVLIPVYETSVLVDAVVLNSIQFWVGRNPGGQTAQRQPQQPGDAVAQRSERSDARARLPADHSDD